MMKKIVFSIGFFIILMLICNLSNATTMTNEENSSDSSAVSNEQNVDSSASSKSSEARLSNLGITPNDFSGFKRDKTEYSAEVPNNVTEVNVYANTVHKNAKVTGTGKVTLKEGNNTVKVKVTAEDGKTTKTYTINIERKTADEENTDTKVTKNEASDTEETVVDQFGLSKLVITGVNLEPGFEVGTYEYNVTLKEDLTLLEIDAEANEENAIVEILGNENLQQGENTITILVTNTETEEVVTYQIVVNKNLTEEDDEQKSWLKLSTWGKEDKMKMAIIIILIVLIVSAIILKVKMVKENSEERDLPGADELDKAIAEHQELSAEEIEGAIETDEVQTIEENIENVNNEKNMHEYESETNYIQDIAKSRFGVEYEEQEETKVKPRKKGKGRHF